MKTLTEHLSNNAPRDADDFREDLDTVNADLGDWSSADIGEDHLEALQASVERAASLSKEATAAHKAYKEPHLVAGRKVDDAFRPYKSGFDDAHKALKRILGEYLAERQRVADEKARKLREEAEAKAREAAEAENAFLATDEDAEKAAAAAKSAERQAEAAGYSKTGSGRAISLRTYYGAQVQDAASLVAHYATHPDVIEAALKLANAEARSSKGKCTIPGVTITEEKRAA